MMRSIEKNDTMYIRLINLLNFWLLKLMKFNKLKINPILCYLKIKFDTL